jgi:ribosomal subunit interface protein
MHVQVSGKQIDIGDALRGHVTQRLDELVAKFFDRAIDATVVFSRDGHLLQADCLVHTGVGIPVQSSGAATDIYASFDQAADRLESRLRKYKRRIRNHHARRKAEPAGETAGEAARSYVLAAEPEESGEEAADTAPVIVAETTTRIDTLTVSEAVMRLDLADVPALMFRNSAHGGLNIVYRRRDGNIGWIDPSEPGR